MRSVSALIRGTIFVRDLDRASAFYAALGFTEVYYEGVLTDPSASHILGFGAHGPLAARIVKSAAGNPNYGMVGLFLIDAALSPETLAPAAGPARVGEVALVFYVPDLAATLARLRAAGASWSPEPQMFRMAHRAQPEVCLRDPDGVLLNLVETDPAEQERCGREGG